MISSGAKELTREQLYEKVWSAPTTHIVAELGISDVALAKRCKKLNVPKPSLGYWAKVAAGQMPETPQEKWAFVHTQADSLFEIGRVHFYEDAPAAAQEFLTKALLLAKEADALREKAGMTDDLLEGRIGELLVQLPDENKP